MSAIAATVNGITLLHADASGKNATGLRHTFLLSCSFAAYTGASDNAKITGVAAMLETFLHRGTTITWEASSVQALCAGYGLDTNSQKVFAGTFAVSSADLTFNLTNAAGAELTSSTAVSGVQIVVAVDIA